MKKSKSTEEQIAFALHHGGQVDYQVRVGITIGPADALGGNQVVILTTGHEDVLAAPLLQILDQVGAQKADPR